MAGIETPNFNQLSAAAEQNNLQWINKPSYIMAIDDPIVKFLFYFKLFNISGTSIKYIFKYLGGNSLKTVKFPLKFLEIGKQIQ